MCYSGRGRRNSPMHYNRTDTHTTRMQAGYSPPSQYKYATASFSIASTLPDFAALQTREGQNTFFKSCTQTDTRPRRRLVDRRCTQHNVDRRSVSLSC